MGGGEVVMLACLMAMRHPYWIRQQKQFGMIRMLRASLCSTACVELHPVGKLCV